MVVPHVTIVTIGCVSVPVAGGEKLHNVANVIKGIAPQECAVRPRPHADAALLAAARHVVIVQVHAVDALVVREHAP